MNERIDHSNYEAWLLDRLEGNLTPEQERALDAFLLLHPELAPELDELPTLQGPGLGLSAADKNALKRALPPTGRPDEASIEDFLIAQLEGDLTADQVTALRAYLAAHPEHAKAQRLYALTKLVPAAMAYAEKQGLVRTLPPQGLPTHSTLDDHLVARTEGDLTAEQERALRAFLLAHPQHARAERLHALTKLVPVALAYAEKQDLHRSLPPTGLPTRYTVNDFLVARLEGELTSVQDMDLTAYLATDPVATRAWTLMQHTRVQAASMVYADKAGLKKKEGRVIALNGGARTWMVRLAAAASVAVLVGIGLWLLRDNSSSGSEFAGKEEKVPGQQEQRAPAQQNGTRPENDAVTPEQDATAPEQNDNAAQNDPVQPGMQEDAPARVQQDVRTPEQQPAPRLEERAPVPQLAERRTVQVPSERPDVTPRNVPVPDVQVVEEPLAAAAPTQASQSNVSIGGLVASAFRDRVLEEPTADTRPLDSKDAVAAVDKGLKAVGGDRAGLSVERTNGRLRTFDLRLGRNLAITANR